MFRYSVKIKDIKDGKALVSCSGTAAEDGYAEKPKKVKFAFEEWITVGEMTANEDFSDHEEYTPAPADGKAVSFIPNGGAEPKDLEIAEQLAGFTFPEDLLRFLLEQNGANPETPGNHIILPSVKEKLSVRFLYGITQISGTDASHFIPKELKDRRHFIPEQMDRHYIEIAAKKAIDQVRVTDAELVILTENSADDEDEDALTIRLFNTLLARGYSTNVSDIPIEPFEKHTSIRMRIDGLMVDYATFARSMQSSLVDHVKITSNLDIVERRMPQDGNFRTVIDDYDISVRVSAIPTVYGEKVVMRYNGSLTSHKADRKEYEMLYNVQLYGALDRRPRNFRRRTIRNM